jgi:hypothetical protein
VLDFSTHFVATAEGEADLGDDEERADEQPDEVVHEGRLPAFEGVSDELDHPSEDEEAGKSN